MIGKTNSFEKYSSYCFGREAEFIVAVFLKARGWKLSLSKGSRGPADIIATRDSMKWLIQVKCSNLVPRVKGYEIRRLTELAEFVNASAVIATIQPSSTVMFKGVKRGIGKKNGIFLIGNYSLVFYHLPTFSRIFID